MPRELLTPEKFKDSCRWHLTALVAVHGFVETEPFWNWPPIVPQEPFLIEYSRGRLRVSLKRFREPGANVDGYIQRQTVHDGNWQRVALQYVLECVTRRDGAALPKRGWRANQYVEEESVIREAGHLLRVVPHLLADGERLFREAFALSEDAEIQASMETFGCSPADIKKMKTARETGIIRHYFPERVQRWEERVMSEVGGA